MWVWLTPSRSRFFFLCSRNLFPGFRHRPPHVQERTASCLGLPLSSPLECTSHGHQNRYGGRWLQELARFQFIYFCAALSTAGFLLVGCSVERTIHLQQDESWILVHEDHFQPGKAPGSTHLPPTHFLRSSQKTPTHPLCGTHFIHLGRMKG